MLIMKGGKKVCQETTKKELIFWNPIKQNLDQNYYQVKGIFTSLKATITVKIKYLWKICSK